MNILNKNEIWLFIFSLTLLYWIFNISVPGVFLMLIPFVMSLLVKS